MSDINEITELPDYELTKTEVAAEIEESIQKDENGIVVNCPASIYLARKDVKYGTVTHITYYSETAKCERGANILLPADYNENKKYPVIYLQHGIFGDEYCMINDENNKIKEIFGNMVADGLTRESIVVLTNMYVTGDPELKPGFSQEQCAPYDRIVEDIENDLMPYMEKNYSILTGRENTGVLGFSMGGRESLFMGITRPDLFAYAGAISPAPGVTPGKDWAMEHPGQLAEKDLKIKDAKNPMKLLMVECGTDDKVVGKFPESYHNIMTANGQEHIWYEVPGADHDNKAIRSGIYNFLLRW